MKNEFLYSFLTVIFSFIIGLVLFAFMGNENSRNAMLLVNILIVLLFTHLYFQTSNATAGNFAIILFAVSIALYVVIIGIVMRQGLSFFYSPHFWIMNVERVAVPFIYEHFKRKPIARVDEV